MMATSVFGVGAEQFGLMSSASAIGAITAGLLAARRTQIPLRLIVGALAAFTAAIDLLTFAPNYWFYLLVMVPTGVLLAHRDDGCEHLGAAGHRSGDARTGDGSVHGDIPRWDAFGGSARRLDRRRLGPALDARRGRDRCGLAAAVAVLYLMRRRGWEWPWRRDYDEQAYIALPDQLR